MLKAHSFAALSMTGLLVLGAGLAQGQEFPTKPVRIVTGGVGGGGDFASRLLGQGLSGNWGQQVVVDNRPNGVIPGDLVAKSAPDGYTLLVAVNLLWVGHLLQPNEPYDVVRDFAPVTLAAISPNVLLIHPSVPAKTVKELIALGRSKPGQLSYGTGANGSASHLSAELFKSMAHIDMVRIPYKSNSQQSADLMGGHIQMMLGVASAMVPYVNAGRLRALGVTSAQRSVAFPNLPTISEAGLPGFEAVLYVGVFAPAKTPAAIVNRINQELLRVLAKPDMKEKMLSAGMETAGTTPDQFAGIMKTDIARWDKVIKEAGIKLEQ